MADEATTPVLLSDQERFKARLTRYRRGQVLCVILIGVCVFYLFLRLHFDWTGGTFPILTLVILVCHLGYLEAQKRRLLRRGPQKSNKDWSFLWDDKEKP